MNCWKILQIERTYDVQLIKKAYRTLLKQTKPEENEKGFMELREAYENALLYAEEADSEYYDDYADEYERSKDDCIEYDNIDEEYDSEEEYVLSEEEIAFEEWRLRLDEIYSNYARRIDINEWKQLLYGDIPIQLKYVERCKEYVYWRLNSAGTTFLPDEVTGLLDDFFAYTGTEVERSKSRGTERLRSFNKRIKLDENIEYEKLIAADNAESEAIDRFFYLYSYLWKNAGSNSDASELYRSLDELKGAYDKNSFKYLPYECQAAAQLMKEQKETEAEIELGRLKEEYPEAAEVRLLEAELLLHRGDEKQAAKLLRQLYKVIPPKSYPFTYQLALCCKAAGLYYEAYQLIKYLTWMRPEAWQFEMADEISRLLEADEAADKVSLCRILLRSNREAEAEAMLAGAEVKSGWEYYMALCLCQLNHEEMVGEPEGYSILEQYEKAELNVIQLLEWEDLKVRCLYEQKRYDEAIAGSNELLKEYPLSYQVLLLRSHIDYSRGQLKEKNLTVHMGSGLKDFHDLEYLIPLNEKRVEARLLAACIQVHAGDYECALRELEPVKDILSVEYDYCRLNFELYEKKKNAYDVLEDWKGLWGIVSSNNVRMPAVSKHYLFSLEKLFSDAAELGANTAIEKAKKEEYRKLLLSLADSEYNHPEKYVNLLFMYRYFDIDNFEEAEEYILDKHSKAVSLKEHYDVMNAYVNICYDFNHMELAEVELDKYTGEWRDYLINRLYLGIGKYYEMNGEYEKAVSFYEMNPLDIQDFAYMASGYNNLKQYEKARECCEKAILHCTCCGDYWDADNFYNTIAWTYFYENNYPQVYKYLRLAKAHTENEKVKKRVLKNYAYFYTDEIWDEIENGNIERVYELVEMVPEDVKIYMSFALARVYDFYVENNKGSEDCTEYINKAVEYYIRDIKEGRDQASSYGRLAWMYRKLDRYEEAWAVLDYIIKLMDELQQDKDYPSDDNYYLDAYHLCVAQKRWDEALEYLNKAVEDTGYQSIKEKYGIYYADAFENKIWGYVEKGDYISVLRLVDNVLEDAKPYLNYAIATGYEENLLQKKYAEEDYSMLVEKVKEYYYRDINEGKAFYASYGRIGFWCMEEDNYEEAEMILKKAVECCEKYNDKGDYWGDNIYFQLAELYMKQKKWEQALELLELRLKYNMNERAELRYNSMAGFVLYNLEKYQKAYELYMKICEDLTWRDFASRGMIAFGMREYALARKHYEEAIDMEGAPVRLLLNRIAHCEYMENGSRNKEVYLALEKELLSLKEQPDWDEKDNDALYFELSDVALAADDMPKAEKYLELVEDKENYEDLGYFMVWRDMYKGNYEVAYERIVEGKAYEGDGETRGLWNYLKARLGKE